MCYAFISLGKTAKYCSAPTPAPRSPSPLFVVVFLIAPRKAAVKTEKVEKSEGEKKTSPEKKTSAEESKDTKG